MISRKLGIGTAVAGSSCLVRIGWLLSRWGVFPLDDCPFVVKIGQERIRRGVRPRWEFRPPFERLPFDVAPWVCGHSHTITCELVRSPGHGDGVIVACGAQPAGYVLHITGGRLIYEQSLLPWMERIESHEVLPDGDVTVRYVQTMTARPFEGRGALFVNKRQVAEHAFTRTLTSTSLDGFSLGVDPCRVSTGYPAPHSFQGRIVRVVIDVDTTPFSSRESMRFLGEMGIKV